MTLPGVDGPVKVIDVGETVTVAGVGDAVGVAVGTGVGDGLGVGEGPCVGFDVGEWLGRTLGVVGPAAAVLSTAARGERAAPAAERECDQPNL